MEMESNRLIVTYLPAHTTEVHLCSLFRPYGRILSLRIVRNDVTGLPRGFGFVDFLEVEDAKAALEALNGVKFWNKRLKVDFVRPPNQIANTNLRVFNIPLTFTEICLDALFGPFGRIIHRKILRSNIDYEPLGSAFVRFANAADARAAITALNGAVLPGRDSCIFVALADDIGKKKSSFVSGLKEGFRAHTEMNIPENLPIPEQLQYQRGFQMGTAMRLNNYCFNRFQAAAVSAGITPLFERE